MKKRIIASLFFIIALVSITTLAGCFATNTSKTTGGGSFTADSSSFDSTGSLQGHFCTFGFNAFPTNTTYTTTNSTTYLNAHGMFQFVDHSNKTNIKGNFQITQEIIINNSPNTTGFGGLCTINKTGSYAFAAGFIDNGPGQQDNVAIMVVDNGLNNLIDDVNAYFNSNDTTHILYLYSGPLNPGSDIVYHAQ